MRYPTLFSGHSTKSRWLSGRKALIFLQHGNSWGELLAYLSTCALNDNLLSISKPDMYSKLWFNAHVDKICKNLASRIAVLRKIWAFLPLSQRVKYYNAVIRPVMSYASVIWSSCDKEQLYRVLTLQKRAARVILYADRQGSSVALFNKLLGSRFMNNQGLISAPLFISVLIGLYTYSLKWLHYYK